MNPLHRTPDPFTGRSTPLGRRFAGAAACVLLTLVSLLGRPLPVHAFPDEPAETELTPIDPIPPQLQPYPINLDTALRLAERENPEIALARVAIMGSEARATLASLLLAPNLNAGTNYHGHVGNLQRSSGRILSLSEQSLYLGGGARTVAAETLAIPAVNIASPLADALFEPLATRRHLAAAQHNARAVGNATLRNVAVAYYDLIRAQAMVDVLTTSFEESSQIKRITNDFAQAGRGRQADADRADADWGLLRAELQASHGELLAASARLAELLNLDPALPLHPVGHEYDQPLTLVDDQIATETLVVHALQHRPEVAAQTATVGEFEARYKEELWRPALPTLWLGMSGGAMGGGSNIVPPLVGNFGGRTDFDVRLYWTLLNLGVGNRGLQKRRRAELGQASAELMLTVNTIRREVAVAQAESASAYRQLELRRLELASSGRGFLEDRNRSRLGLGRPIEVLNNLGLLINARLDLIRAVILYNQSQVRLFVALGSPPPLEEPLSATAPPPPSLTVPLRSPVPVR